MLVADGSSISPTISGETAVKSVKIPAGLMRPNDILRADVWGVGNPAWSGIATFGFRLGPNAVAMQNTLLGSSGFTAAFSLNGWRGRLFLLIIGANSQYATAYFTNVNGTETGVLSGSEQGSSSVTAALDMTVDQFLAFTVNKGPQTARGFLVRAYKSP